MGILNFAYRGSNLQVMPAFDRKLAETKCVSCGQCAAVCTTGAITVKNQIGEAVARHPRPQQARCHPDRARRARGRGRGVRLSRGRKRARQARHGAQAHGRGRGVRHDVRRGLYDDRRIRRIPRAPEKRRPVPDVHLLLPGVGEVSRKREPQVFEEHFDLQVADGDGRRDLPRQVRREGRCRWPHDLSHRHHALHGEEDGGRAAPSSSTTVDPTSTLCSPRAR